MNSLSLKFTFLFLCLLKIEVIAQGNNPWDAAAQVPWAGNPSNSTQFRWANYFNHFSAGAYHLGTFTQATNTSGYNVASDSRCDNSNTRDIWFVIPPHPSGAGTIRVRPTVINYTTSDPISARYVIYKGTSCIGSGACNLTYVTSYCNSALDTEGSCTAGVGGMYTGTHDIAVSAGESIYVQMWADDDDGDMSGSVYGFYNSTSASAPTNDACASPIFINSTSSTSWSGNNFGAAGTGDISPPSACGWNVSDQTVYYYFQANSTSVSLTLNGVSCMFTSCPGAPGSDLQVAVYGPNTSSPVSACSPGTYRACANNTGNFTINLTGLVVGSRYIIAVDALSGKICSWSGISMTNISVLPIELTSFTSEIKTNNSIQLVWQTANEINNEKFIIERSENGTDFYSIGEVRGHGTTQEKQDYEFVDAKPKPGILYYRLRQVDYHGKNEIHKTISIEISVDDFIVFPNPAKENISLSFKNTDLVPEKIELMNYTGELIQSDMVKENGIYSFDIKYLPKGLYFTKVFYNKSIYVKSFVIGQ